MITALRMSTMYLTATFVSLCATFWPEYMAPRVRPCITHQKSPIRCDITAYYSSALSRSLLDATL